ncbi:MAG: molecular chaperone DnaJ [Rhodospirillaceae bacterium]|nr:molecular chaperone DnaJ [Rhodospirillaceae bacterium]HAA92014.1 molecular chaperone DnaJ [Rhodospirillaceae bacterium]
MAMKDPYSVIGVGKSASPDDIKKAYRRLAKELHPDLNPDDKVVEQRFKEVSAAYNLLSDPEQRAKFDRGEINADGSAAYENAFHRAYSQGGGQTHEFNFGQGGANFDDIFSDLFGQGRARQQRTRQRSVKGRNVSYTVRVSFEEAAQGAKRRIKLFDEKMLDVKVPAGTTDGQVLRLKSQGMRGIGGGSAGDALVTIQVDKHPLFTLDGHDIHLTVPITLDEAVLGAKITVPTVGGRVSLNVPEGTSSGAKLRLRGKGLASKGTKAGDQIVTLNIVLPEEADEELKKFAKKWSRGDGAGVRKKAGLDD